MRMSTALILSLATGMAVLPAAAQAPQAKPADVKTEPKAMTQEEARKAFNQVLDAVDAGWFGQTYKGVTSVGIQGSLGLTPSAQGIQRKADELSQGQVKATSKGGTVNLRLNGTYFADGDFKTEFNGDFGNLLYTRRGPKGYLFSKELNAYTTGIDLAPADAPQTFMSWFRLTIQDIKDVYIKGPVFKAEFTGEDVMGGRTLQKVVFSAPTKPWDAKKREQGLAETLGFWKRGVMQVSFDKETKLPVRMSFRNDEQGVATSMDFSYDAKGKLAAVSLGNQSRGFEGPGSLRLGYGKDGLISSLAGELNSKAAKIAFDLTTNWSKDRKATSLASVPPAGAAKKSREELETQLLVSAAGKLVELQRNGINIRSLTLASAK